MINRKGLMILGISTVTGAALGFAVLIVINTSILRFPEAAPSSPTQWPTYKTDRPAEQDGHSDYKVISERNLFRAKLQAEIPKPKTEKEIEEEVLTGIVKAMLLKGVMLGTRQKDNYAIIDRGGQKGVWTYEMGDVIERGLILKEIRKDSIKVEKAEFAAVLKLFSPVYEKTTGTQVASIPVGTQPPQKKAGSEQVKLDLVKDIRREGSVTLVSKSLAEKVKTDSNIVMSAIAIKMGSDGLKVVTVDKGSIAQRMGIAPDDTLQEVNGQRLNSSQDMNKVYEALKNATSFEVRVLRRGRPETLRYEIR
jgi:type II secretory pathway component PulC